ncbi:metallophosphoesterase family protein [Nitrospirillum sp. BR 11828]|uniref:metallophosphoesterase family protein n=1 Tax=Nitrospirillum sp. BR 11828 TaxID=3104325 RepID=UPI002ACA62FB|nr:metallophosphoesterase [Nitrospirillum sp. BR 11828]MDZ5649624.1 metallophosphoesterase [Nitrospirillum sp. BR 11828]
MSSSQTFVIVGDFGSGGVDCHNATDTVSATAALGVAQAVASAMPAGDGGFIISLGDQIYQPWSSGDETKPATPAEYNAAVGIPYGAYIDYTNVPSAYVGSNVGTSMQLFPVIGDHDWWKQQQRGEYNNTVTNTTVSIYEMSAPGSSGEPTDNYQSYFAGLGLPVGAPGDGSDGESACIRYYSQTFAGGLIELFVLSNDPNEVALGTLNMAALQSCAPEPNLSSPQITWFKNALTNSTATWKIVAMHQPPYTTSDPSKGGHYPTRYFQLVDLVANSVGKTVDLVLAGHVHSYERLQGVDASGGVTTYIVNGAGGSPESFAQFLSQTNPNMQPPPVSPVQVSGYYGYQLATATASTLSIQFYGAQDPANCLGTTVSTTWTLFDSVMIVKPNTTLTVSDITATSCIGLVTQGTTTIQTDDSTSTLSLNLFGPGDITVSGGGTLNFKNPAYPSSPRR